MQTAEHCSTIRNVLGKRPHSPCACANNKTDLGRSVRTAPFTFIEWPDHSTQLYNHATDPKESFNLSKDDHYAQTATKMKQLLDDG